MSVGIQEEWLKLDQIFWDEKLHKSVKIYTGIASNVFVATSKTESHEPNTPVQCALYFRVSQFFIRKTAYDLQIF